MIGKRKRETTVMSRKKTETMEAEERIGEQQRQRQRQQQQQQQQQQENHHELFRQYFEARFKPIEERVDIREAKAAVDADDADDADDDDGSQSGSEWDGLSGEDEEDEAEEQQPVEVVAYDSSQRREDDELARAEFKSFMTSKPPSSTTIQTKSQSHSRKPTTTKDTSNGPESATESLQNDLALQRLLKESHLLEPTTATTTTSQSLNLNLNPTGKNRHKALDLRMQALGSRDSIYAQEKMPLAHRRGIVEKKGEREERRRREARENGIVLEKERRTSGSGGGGGDGGGDGKKKKRRERGIGGPGVGRFQGGMLRLSQRDVREIQGPSGSRRGGGNGGNGKGKGKKRSLV